MIILRQRSFSYLQQKEFNKNTRVLGEYVDRLKKELGEESAKPLQEKNEQLIAELRAKLGKALNAYHQNVEGMNAQRIDKLDRFLNKLRTKKDIDQKEAVKNITGGKKISKLNNEAFDHLEKNYPYGDPRTFDEALNDSKEVVAKKYNLSKFPDYDDIYAETDKIYDNYTKRRDKLQNIKTDILMGNGNITKGRRERTKDDPKLSELGKNSYYSVSRRLKNTVQETERSNTRNFEKVTKRVDEVTPSVVDPYMNNAAAISAKSKKEVNKIKRDLKARTKFITDQLMYQNPNLSKAQAKAQAEAIITKEYEGKKALEAFTTPDKTSVILGGDHKSYGFIRNHEGAENESGHLGTTPIKYKKEWQGIYETNNKLKNVLKSETITNSSKRDTLRLLHKNENTITKLNKASELQADLNATIANYNTPGIHSNSLKQMTEGNITNTKAQLLGYGAEEKEIPELMNFIRDEDLVKAKNGPASEGMRDYLIERFRTGKTATKPIRTTSKKQRKGKA